MPTTAFPAEGGCDCRAVRFRLQTAPLFVHCCHCRWCQRESGAAFALNAMIEADRVVNLGIEPEVVRTPSASGLGQQIVRCPACRVALWSHYAGSGPVVAFVRARTQPRRAESVSRTQASAAAHPLPTRFRLQRGRPGGGRVRDPARLARPHDHAPPFPGAHPLRATQQRVAAVLDAQGFEVARVRAEPTAHVAAIGLGCGHGRRSLLLLRLTQQADLIALELRVRASMSPEFKQMGADEIMAFLRADSQPPARAGRGRG